MNAVIYKKETKVARSSKGQVIQSWHYVVLVLLQSTLVPTGVGQEIWQGSSYHTFLRQDLDYTMTVVIMRQINQNPGRRLKEILKGTNRLLRPMILVVK